MMLIGETFIRRSLKTPAGTFRQRTAWAAASGAYPGDESNVAVVVDLLDECVLFATRPGGFQKNSPVAFTDEWERP